MAIYYGDSSNSATGRTVQIAQFEYLYTYSASSNSGWRAILTGANLNVKKADSKILFQVQVGRLSGPSNSVAARMVRDRGGTDLTAIGVHASSPSGSWQNYGQGPVNNDHADNCFWQWLDTHGKAAGGAVYYQLQLWGQNNGTVWINRAQNTNDTNEPYAVRTGSSIILTEITV